MRKFFSVLATHLKDATSPGPKDNTSLGECLLISSLPDKALIMLVESRGSAERFNMRSRSSESQDSTCVLEAETGISLISKDANLIFYLPD